jgi:hypothetical protein
MASPHPDAGGQPRLNWSLLLALGLCVEFWIVVTTAVAQNL